MSLPPPGLAGLDPAWSREVLALDSRGVPRNWHLLDTNPDGLGCIGTVLCVHGNPTWSYLWRRVVADPPAGWRVIAVDQLEMGYSQRTGQSRTLAERVVDLTGLTTALNLTGPVVVVAHDWGGPISLGWTLGQVAAARGDRSAIPAGAAPEVGTGADVVGIVLTNTGVHQPEDHPAPWPLRMATVPGVLPGVTSRTGGFITSALWLSRPLPPPGVRAGYHAPYRSRARRAGVEAFVRDIPFEASHGSAPELDRIAAGVASELEDVPVLLAWGTRDPVFSQIFLHDLLSRLPHADVQLYRGSSHLVAEDAPTFPADLAAWVTASVTARLAGEGTADRPVTPSVSTRPSDVAAGTPTEIGSADQGPADQCPAVPFRPVWADLVQRARDERAGADRARYGLAESDRPVPAIVELGRQDVAASISFPELDSRIAATAAGWQVAGLLPGDRVAVLVPPGVEFVVALFSVWRAGGVAVVVDAGLGLRGMRAALASAGPKWVVGQAKGLAAARAMRLRARMVLAGAPGNGALDGALRNGALGNGALGRTAARVTHPETSLAELAGLGEGRDLPAQPDPNCDALIAFTSGATGPAKGVAYHHRHLASQREAIRAAFDVTPADALVAGFGPFALIAPALGIPTAIPDMDIMAPRTLSAAALADAVAAVGATLVFAAPAALVNLAATAGQVIGPEAGTTAAGSRRLTALRGVRLLLSAGAPVPEPVLVELTRSDGLLPSAVAHTPYGMTECLPVADITGPQMHDAGPGNGVCVGWPIPGVSVRISALDAAGVAVGELSEVPEVTGEIVVRAPHVKARYDRLWVTQAASARPSGWHRTGDVGHLDVQGRLWVEGRMVHIITTARGPVTPVGIERAITDSQMGLTRAAAVGVGPADAQVVVVVVEDPALRPGLAPDEIRDRVRDVIAAALPSAPDVTAVLTTRALPTDIRHNSKIDRTRVAGWADRVLAGGRIGRP